jgi:hypothetical protein
MLFLNLAATNKMTIKFETLLLIAMLFLVRDRGFQGSVFRKLQETEAGVQSDESSSGYNFENKIVSSGQLSMMGIQKI